MPERRQVLATLGTAGVCGVAGCTGLLGTTRSTPTIAIGIIADTSSEAVGEAGTNLVEAIRLPLEQLTESGLDVTVTHRTEDTGGDVTAALSGARSLAGDGYPAVVGPTSSRRMLRASREVLVPERVVACSPAATTPQLTTLEDDGYVFRTVPSDAFQGTVQALVATATVGAQRVATLYVDDQYGTALNDTFVSRFRVRGGEISAQVAFRPGKRTYSSELDTALATDPDALLLATLSRSGPVILQDYYAEYADHDIIVPDGMKFASVMDQIDNDLSNVVGTAPLAAGPNRDAFDRRYREAYGVPTNFTPHGYDASAVLALASLAGESADSPLKNSVRPVAGPGGRKVGPDTLVEGARRVLDGDPIEYVGASSPVVFDSNGDMATATYEVWTYDSPDSFRREDTVSFSR